MKYGETIFDILYLLTAILIGLIILIKHKNKKELLIGLAILILGVGDSFHLIPRILNYFIDYDFTMYLGIGKLITSITMTIFYLLMYHILLKSIDIKENKHLTKGLIEFVILRIILCLSIENNWLTNNSPLLWQIIRNIPFIIIGYILIRLYYKHRYIDNYKYIWLYMTLSFIFYIPVVIGANTYPILGMLMLPKTICYVLIIKDLYKSTK